MVFKGDVMHTFVDRSSGELAEQYLERQTIRAAILDAVEGNAVCVRACVRACVRLSLPVPPPPFSPTPTPFFYPTLLSSSQ